MSNIESITEQSPVVDNLDEILNELSPEAPTEVSISAEELAAITAPIEVPTIAQQKAEAYAAQESAEVSMEPVKPGKGKAGKVKAAKVAKDPSAPVEVKRLSTADMTAKEALIYKIGTDPTNYVLDASHAVLDAPSLEAHRDAFMDSADKLAKKVREKLINLMDWAVKGSELSVYTAIAMKQLADTGTLTSAGLKNAYQTNAGKAYSEGTANAQAGQMFQLFTQVGIAKKADKGLVANETSVLLAKFKAGPATT
jgi:hypothetical protein